MIFFGWSSATAEITGVTKFGSRRDQLRVTRDWHPLSRYIIKIPHYNYDKSIDRFIHLNVCIFILLYLNLLPKQCIPSSADEKEVGIAPSSCSWYYQTIVPIFLRDAEIMYQPRDISDVI